MNITHKLVLFLAASALSTAALAAGSEDASPPEGKDPKAASREAPDESEAQPLMLPGGIRIGGLFNAAYERRDRSGDLTSGRNEFRSYHRFLFLTRQGRDFPVGFNAEVLGLHFYELTARLPSYLYGVRLSVHAGKIMVPFGPDPLFHKHYGGTSGPDQQLLPVVWSSFGAGLRATRAFGKLSVADELYVVQGFDVSARDQMLSMQRDLQAYDGARIAVGNRLAVSHGPFTLWYSLYWNPLRFGRRLFMQAVDVTVWKPDLPVLDHFAFGLGVMRAHVTRDERFGQPDAVAGANAYFHFADYLWMRAFLYEWLYLQVRSGLVTVGNQKGFFYDAERASASDVSHHNIALVAEHMGAQVSLAYFWNFEKVDERADDFLRLMVTYAF